MRRRWLAPTALVVISFLLAMGVVEIALRVARIDFPVFYVPDEVTGFSLRPNVEGWWRREGGAYIRINSSGLRDVDHVVDKPGDVYRIAVLGDSYAEALQVSLADTFWKVLERELGGCKRLSGRRIEVINFGVSGYGTAQELLTWRARARSYTPDIVLLAFVSGNDLRNNLRQLEQDSTRPYFVRNGAGLELDNSFRETLTYRVASAASPLMDRSRVVRLADTMRLRIKRWRKASGQAHRSTNVEDRELGLDDMVYRAPTDPDWLEAWAVTEAVLKRLQEETKAGGATLLVASLSNGVQVHPDRAVRERFMRRLGVNDLYYPESRLAAVGQRNGIWFLALAPHMQKIAQDSNVSFHGFDNTQPGYGHWNESGHRYAGTKIAEEICGQGHRFISR